jgi:hypothetical protein
MDMPIVRFPALMKFYVDNQIEFPCMGVTVAELLDNRGNLVVVGVVDARKEVMLNLVVKASVEDGEPEAADVGGGNNLIKGW